MDLKFRVVKLIFAAKYGERLNKYSQRNPKEIKSSENLVMNLYDQGLALHQAGHINEAENIYLKILKIESNHFDAVHMLGLIEYQKNNLEKALELISKTITINSKNAFAYNNLGVVLMGLDRPKEALLNYDRAIFLKPDYAEVHSNKGAAFARLGLPNEAFKSYELALEIKPDYEEVYYKRGNLLLEINRFQDALRDYEKAIKLKPQYSPAYTNRGNALFRLGQYDESLESYNKAIELNPTCVNSYSNRGNVLLKLKKYNEALESYDRAIALDPFHAESFSNRGVVMKELAQFDRALESYDRAISLKPNYPDPYINRGNILMELGKWELAFENYLKLLEFDRSYKARMGFINCIKNITSIKVTSNLEILIEQAISGAWGRPSDLIPIARNLLLLKLGLNSPQELPRDVQNSLVENEKIYLKPGVNALLNNSLFQCILKNDSINNANFELLLTDVRRSLLFNLIEKIEFYESQILLVKENDGEDRLLKFLCALAVQCFINEYVYANSDEELAQVEILRKKIFHRQSSNMPIPAVWVALTACYMPLSALQNHEKLLEKAWPEFLKQLFTMQIIEPKIERSYRENIPKIGCIDDRVSKLVREQYELNPYPRWVKTIDFVEGVSLNEFMAKTFPNGLFQNLPNDNSIDILVAGCGTGQHPIETAQVYKNSKVLAIDLSLASLCYAKRKAIEMGVRNIEFAQADILELGSINKKFDLIESVGVLHHLEEPLKGWCVLLDLLRPNGFMKLGLYSEIARASVVAAREYIRERKFSTSTEDIRLCRQEILNFSEKNSISKVINFTDFFGLSECRDLIFHVQEHRYTLIQLKDTLRKLNLNFIGFTLKPSVEKQYLERFPEDLTKTNLDNWHLFEMDFPDTFKSMYQFYVQKL